VTPAVPLGSAAWRLSRLDELRSCGRRAQARCAAWSGSATELEETSTRSSPMQYETILSVPTGLTGPTQLEYAGKGDRAGAGAGGVTARVYSRVDPPLPKLAIDLGTSAAWRDERPVRTREDLRSAVAGAARQTPVASAVARGAARPVAALVLSGLVGCVDVLYAVELRGALSRRRTRQRVDGWTRAAGGTPMAAGNAPGHESTSSMRGWEKGCRACGRSTGVPVWISRSPGPVASPVAPAPPARDRRLPCRIRLVTTPGILARRAEPVLEWIDETDDESATDPDSRNRNCRPAGAAVSPPPHRSHHPRPHHRTRRWRRVATPESSGIS
jgi:hypothetical protein